MGQDGKRVWDTGSERARKAAYRARKAQEQEGFSGTPTHELDTAQSAPVFKPEYGGLEAYVAREVAITKAQTSDPDKLKRSEAYARWRWREFCAGTVSAL